MTEQTTFKIISDKEFKDAVQREQTEGLAVRKGWTCDIVKVIDEEKRIIDFIISTESVDRMNDVVTVSGWEFDNYLKNPVVLFGHDHGSPPIAKAISITKRPKLKRLESRAEFMTKEMSEFSDSIFQMYVHGFMKAVSVGFIPLEYHRCEDEENRPWGMDFMKQELLEYSAVPVPANPDAIMNARSKGINTAPIKEWAEQILDSYAKHAESGFYIPKKTMEQIRAQADPTRKKTLHIPKAKQNDLAEENLVSITAQLEDNLQPKVDLVPAIEDSQTEEIVGDVIIIPITDKIDITKEDETTLTTAVEEVIADIPPDETDKTLIVPPLVPTIVEEEKEDEFFILECMLEDLNTLIDSIKANKINVKEFQNTQTAKHLIKNLRESAQEISNLLIEVPVTSQENAVSACEFYKIDVESLRKELQESSNSNLDLIKSVLDEDLDRLIKEEIKKVVSSLTGKVE